jgi:hypothetical protein
VRAVWTTRAVCSVRTAAHLAPIAVEDSRASAVAREVGRDRPQRHRGRDPAAALR